MKANNLSNAVIKALEDYNEEVIDTTKKVVQEVAGETVEEVRNHITFEDKSGKYRRAISFKKAYEDRTNLRVTCYVKSPHYRLTHLLEYGHVTRNGNKRTREFPHMRFGYEYVQNNLVKRLKEEL